jgi:hypothetical protein
MVETRLTCQYCGEKFDTKSDLQDHEMNCLAAGQAQGQRPQQQTGRAQQPTSGRQQPTGGKQQTTGNRTRGAGGGGDWNQGGESGI